MMLMMRSAAAIFALVCVGVSGSHIDDQPPNGVSLPSKFATNIVPELGYSPKM